MKRPILILGVIFVLIGSLLTVWDYNSRPACTCASTLSNESVHELRIFNITNGGIVNGTVLAVRVPLMGQNLTVRDPERDVYVVFNRRGELYLPKTPIFFRRIQVDGLGNEKVEVYANLAGGYVFDVKPGMFVVPESVDAIQFPLTRYGAELGFLNPRGRIVIVDQNRTEIILGDSIKIPRLNITLHGKPRVLKAVYSPTTPKKVWIDGYVDLGNGRITYYTYGIDINPIDETLPALVSVERGSSFTAFNYSHFRLIEGECPVEKIGPEGPLSLSLGLLMIFAGLLWRT
ncbi:hypothetical protein A3L10_00360 [Thermococcus radiotolerans]|uniref:Uncharacterized protein n=1 Tax=Thermococcus radiotolerans TaxID=187880 RepID=A0A2Z2MW50_9EURY|nr:hypothetical protein A3L10_00360 [Thermococcus radiotolerans]